MNDLRRLKELEEEKQGLVSKAVSESEEVKEATQIVEGTGQIADNPKAANEIIDRSDMSTIQKTQAKEVTANPERLARSVKAGNEGTGSLSDSFMESLAFFMPQALGAGIGALFEGSQGALAGADIAGKMAKEKRDFDIQMQNQQMTPYQQEQTRLREEQLKLDKRAEGRRDKQLGLNFEKLELTKQDKAQLSDRQAESISGLDNALKSLDSIKALKPGVTTGPVSGRIQALGELVGAAPKAYTQLKTEAISMANQYIKAITGAQMSEAEAQRIQAVIPKVEDTDNVFVTKMEVFEKIIQRNKDAILQSIKSGQPLRKDVVNAMIKQIQPLEKFKSAATSPYGDVVTRKGKQYKWNASKQKYQLYKGSK